MTIEERAVHLAKEFGATKANKESAIYRACIRMAEEQRKVDIDRFKTVIFNWGVQKGMSYQERQELMQYIDKAMGE